MVNLEHKLTVDDLIVEYMMYKVENGYEPSFTTGEFIKFLLYFESKMTVYDTLYDGEKLFNRFFERKNEQDWSRTVNWNTLEKEKNPHMDMIYSSEDTSYLIKANYRLSDADKSIINTYFMDNGMSRFEHFKGETFKIRSIIGEWLSDYPKRTIDENIEVDSFFLIMGKYLTAEIINIIWKSYIEENIKQNRWPGQCRDIDKYLLEIDLAEIIELKSIKKELLDMYETVSKRIAILFKEDNKLKISSSKGSYLAHSNYKLLINGFEHLFKMAFGQYKSTFLIDMEKLSFTESHEIDGTYDWDDDVDVKTTTTTIGYASVKKLVRSLDKSISKK